MNVTDFEYEAPNRDSNMFYPCRVEEDKILFENTIKFPENIDGVIYQRKSDLETRDINIERCQITYNQKNYDMTMKFRGVNAVLKLVNLDLGCGELKDYYGEYKFIRKIESDVKLTEAQLAIGAKPYKKIEEKTIFQLDFQKKLDEIRVYLEGCVFVMRIHQTLQIEIILLLGKNQLQCDFDFYSLFNETPEIIIDCLNEDSVQNACRILYQQENMKIDKQMQELYQEQQLERQKEQQLEILKLEEWETLIKNVGLKEINSIDDKNIGIFQNHEAGTYQEFLKYLPQNLIQETPVETLFERPSKRNYALWWILGLLCVFGIIVVIIFYIYNESYYEEQTESVESNPQLSQL